MEWLKRIFAGIGFLVTAVFIAGFMNVFIQEVTNTPFTTQDLIHNYEQGYPFRDSWVRFEVREIVQHDHVGQSLWADDLNATFIVEDTNLDVAVGDTVEVVVTDMYEMFNAYIMEFDSANAEVFKGGE